jgi:hypothetical protein
MRLFSLPEATHFCQNFTNEHGDPERSLSFYVNQHLAATAVILSQNTPSFTRYRACLLRDAERNLFLCASQYRRFLDLTIPSSSHWAFVTLYYSSWYAAQALLSMLGGGVFSERFRGRTRGFVVDVSNGAPNRQELRKRLVGNGQGEEPVQAFGSHRQFWEIFYNSMRPFIALVPAHLTVGITPVNGNPLWQITNRNEVNYKALEALSLIENFDSQFAASTFPTSLPGIINTQFGVVEALTELAFNFAGQIGLRTDALNYFGNFSVTQHVRQLIYKPKASGLVKRTRKEHIF